MDTSAVNTVILALIGIGGTVLVWRYIGPILATQEKWRHTQAEEIASLRSEMNSAAVERDMLREMVTQRAQVDDLRQFTKFAVDEGRETHRVFGRIMSEHADKNAEQHQEQLHVMREMVAALKGIEERLTK